MATNIQNIPFEERLRMAQEAARQKGISDDVINQMTQRAVQANTKTIPQTTEQKPEGDTGVKGLFKGASKGLGSTLVNASELGQNVLRNTAGRVVNALEGKGFTKQEKTETENVLTQSAKEFVTPQGTTEKVGFGIEQAGEFLAPGGAISKTGKALEGANVISKLPRVVKPVVKALTGATVEGVGGAGVSVIQDGGTENLTESGTINAGIALVSRPISKIIEQAPVSFWSNILKRTSSQVKKNPILPYEASKLGMVGSKESLVAQSKEAIQAIELQLDDLLSKSKETVDGAKIGQYVQELKDTYKNIPGESYAVNILGTLQQEMREKGVLTLPEANKLKRNIYEVIENSYGKGALDIPSKVAGQKLIASGLKQEIEKVIPEAKKLNEKQAVYIQIRKAIKRQLDQGEGRGIAGVKLGGYDLLTGGLGTIGGIVSGNPLAGVALVGTKKAVESPIVLSAASKLAKYFDELSPTKKQIFYDALKGLSTEGTSSASE